MRHLHENEVPMVAAQHMTCRSVNSQPSIDLWSAARFSFDRLIGVWAGR
jgi:hypothetical protein